MDWQSPPEFEAENSTLVDFSDCSLTYVTTARSASGSAKDLSLKYHGMYIVARGRNARSAVAIRSLSAKTQTSVEFHRAHR